MKFDYDSQKNQSNMARHGVDFKEAQKLWDGDHITIPAKNVSGENRYAVIGRIRYKVYLAVFTERADTIRIISCHRADKKWERIFHDYFKKTRV